MQQMAARMERFKEQMRLKATAPHSSNEIHTNNYLSCPVGISPDKAAVVVDFCSPTTVIHSVSRHAANGEANHDSLSDTIIESCPPTSDATSVSAPGPVSNAGRPSLSTPPPSPCEKAVLSPTNSESSEGEPQQHLEDGISVSSLPPLPPSPFPSTSDSSLAPPQSLGTESAASVRFEQCAALNSSTTRYLHTAHVCCWRTVLSKTTFVFFV